MRRICPVIVLLCLLCGCKGRQGSASPAPSYRPFPRAMVNASGQDAVEHMMLHYWDSFTDTTVLYASDSLAINGVRNDDAEAALGAFATFVQQIPHEVALQAMENFYSRIDAFQRVFPQANMFEKMVAFTSRYFYDPNSPVRDESLYLPFVSRLAGSDLVDPGLHMAYEWDARMCSLNLPGTPAADFPFTDTAGRIRTLYSIKADYTLLIFGNPDCTACRELMEVMESIPEISALIESGRLKVVDIYIDGEVDLWKEHIPEYPATWLNGYDHTMTIRDNLVYDVRALPSLYLLDARKTVLRKDAPEDRILNDLVQL